MNALLEKIRARLRFWGARLNALAALLIAAIVANPGQLEAAIGAMIPATYRPVAGLIAGALTFVIVNIASNSDAKKIANGAR